MPQTSPKENTGLILYTPIIVNNNIPSIIPRVESGEDRVYGDLTSTLKGRETVSDRASALGHSIPLEANLLAICLLFYTQFLPKSSLLMYILLEIYPPFSP